MQLHEYQKMIEHVGEGLQPDGDWMPVLFVEKDRQILVVGMPMFEGESGKDMAAAAIYMTIRACNPDSVAWVTTAWTAPMQVEGKMDKEEFTEAYKKGYITRPSESPSRIEVVSVTCIGVRGQNEGEGFMLGYIERSENKPPRIPKWDVHDEPEIEMAGRFPEAIKKGFADADPKGNLDRLRKLMEEEQNYERGDNTNRNR